jgi:phosphatidylethanolamine-binding protein (PEBP) family uncharacterized protein
MIRTALPPELAVQLMGDKMRVILIGAIVLAGITAASSAGAASLSISFNWCPDRSAAFKIGKVPAGTKTLRFKLTDLDVPTYNHGGGDVAASGTSASVPCGSFGMFSYNGPNPPAGQVHSYRWSVTAVDASGRELASGSATRKYP